ncbi:hypothetical protein [Prosthecomicrobium sp. N25]|uniref:hypothetical protein n=1 Tax=Prosthecomicrobium sp. N25 TaxID=3129254 RepID=UPI00307689F0
MKTYSTAQVAAAAEISTRNVSDLIRSAEPRLIALPPGRGRHGWDFTYPDVLSIALLARLAPLTGDPRWTAKAIADFVFSDVAYVRDLALAQGGILDAEHERRVFQANAHRLVCDWSTAPAPLRHRDMTRPIFVFVDPWLVQSGMHALLTFGVENAGDQIEPAALFARAGHVLNLTWALVHADRALAETAEEAA